MTLTMNIPDNLAASIGSAVDEVRSRFIEGYAVQAYRSGTFSAAEVRELLGHSSRWETEDFLASHGAWPDLTANEVLDDMNNLRVLRAA